MFNLKEYKNKNKKLSSRLPWAFLLDQGIIINKTGSLQSTFEYRGQDLDSSTDSELQSINAQVNNALKRLGSGWAYFVEVQRRKSDFYPVSDWPNEASGLIDLERQQDFKKAGTLFESRYFFTFSYIMPTEQENKIKALFNKNTKLDYSKSLEYFQNEINKIADIFKSFFPYVKRLNDDESLTYLHSCVSTKQHFVQCPDTPMFLDSILTDEIFQGGFYPRLGGSKLALISIKSLPYESYPSILEKIASTACESRWMTRFICMDKEEACRELKKLARHWFAKRKSLWDLVKENAFNEPTERQSGNAIQKASECDAVHSLASEGIVSAGYYTSVIVLFDKDLSALKIKVKMLEQAINSLGFTTIHETFNAVQAWFGTLPGHCWANVRRSLIHSLNLSHLLAISCDWTGTKRVRHFDDHPLFIAKTRAKTPFRFSNMIGDVGHTMIVGPTGSGKSVLLSFIAAQFQRYENSQIFFFDKDYSAKGVTLAMNGIHYDIGNNESKNKLHFQPFRHIEKHLDWAVEWLVNLLQLEKVKVTPDKKFMIHQALDLGLKNMMKKERTLSCLQKIIKNQEISLALNNFKSLFDANSDSFELSNFTCFEMNYLLSDMKSLVIPTLTYIFHKIEKQLTGSPSLIILDEAWLFLSHPTFANKIKDWLKTLRKKNCAVIFATQSLSDIAESNIINTLIESCPTRIFLPNKKAHEAHIKEQYQKFGLNEKQIDIISTAYPKKEYYCQSDIGNRLFDLALGEIALALCASSSPYELRLIKKSEGDNFLHDFLSRRGICYEN